MGSGLDRRVRVVWLLFAVVLAATLVTYVRLPPEETYRVTRSGLAGGLSRAVTYLCYPVALAAVALVWLRCRGWAAWLVAVACAVVAVPGVVSPEDLDAHPVNAVPAAGAVAAALLTWTARGTVGDRQPRAVPLGAGRWALLALLAVWSVPWVCAALGVHAGDLPLLGEVVRSDEPTPGRPGLASVHLGLHEGLFGAQLAATALLLSAVRPLPRGLGAYLALMLCYGVAVSVKDGWNEQVVKRGWSDAQAPDVLEPAATPEWLGLLVAAALVYALVLAREQRTGRRRRPEDPARQPAP